MPEAPIRTRRPAVTRREFVRAMVLGAAAAPIALPNAGAAGGGICPDPDGMLRVRERREFIMGLYQTPKRPAGLREARDAGFNLVRCDATPAAFDEAQTAGLWGWSAVGSMAADALIGSPGAEWGRGRLRDRFESHGTRVWRLARSMGPA